MTPKEQQDQDDSVPQDRLEELTSSIRTLQREKNLETLEEQNNMSRDAIISTPPTKRSREDVQPMHIRCKRQLVSEPGIDTVNISCVDNALREKLTDIVSSRSPTDQDDSHSDSNTQSNAATVSTAIVSANEHAWFFEKYVEFYHIFSTKWCRASKEEISAAHGAVSELNDDATCPPVLNNSIATIESQAPLNIDPSASTLITIIAPSETRYITWNYDEFELSLLSFFPEQFDCYYDWDLIDGTEGSQETWDIVTALTVSPPRPIVDTTYCSAALAGCRQFLSAEPLPPLGFCAMLNHFGFDPADEENFPLDRIQQSIVKYEAFREAKEHEPHFASCQLKFFLTWELTEKSQANIIAMLEEDYEVSDEFLELYEIQNDYYQFHIYMHVFLHVVFTTTHKWCHFASQREDRLAQWAESFEDSVCISTVVAMLSLGVDPKLVFDDKEPTGWGMYLKRSLARLADEIFLFQITEKDTKPWDPRIFGLFTAILWGKWVDAEIPIPPHSPETEFIQTIPIAEKWR